MRNDSDDACWSMVDGAMPQVREAGQSKSTSGGTGSTRTSAVDCFLPTAVLLDPVSLRFTDRGYPRRTAMLPSTRSSNSQEHQMKPGGMESCDTLARGPKVACGHCRRAAALALGPHGSRVLCVDLGSGSGDTEWLGCGVCTCRCTAWGLSDLQARPNTQLGCSFPPPPPRREVRAHARAAPERLLRRDNADRSWAARASPITCTRQHVPLLLPVASRAS